MAEQPAIGAQRRGLYSRLFAKYYDRFVSAYETYIEPRKRELFSAVEGTVVEIGAGTGANLRFLPMGCRWIGIEPNPYMHRQSLEKAAAAGVVAEMRVGTADHIDVDDCTADFVVSTLVLCSVPDVDRVLAEVRRVLKPGAGFLFLEHVAARSGTPRRWSQRLIFPLWYLCGDGCRVSRDTDARIENAGFATVDLERFELPTPPGLPWVSPHIVGSART